MLVTIPIIITSIGLAALGAASMTGAVECGVAVAGVDKAMRAYGYPDDLGPLSDNHGSGVIVGPEGDPIGRKLDWLASSFKDYEWMKGKVFYMKEREAEAVFKHIQAIEANGHWENVRRMATLPPERRAEFAETEQWFKDQLKVSITPLNDLLKAFPKARTGRFSKKKAAA